MPFEMCMEVPAARNVPGERLAPFDDNNYAHAQRFQLARIYGLATKKNANDLALKTEAYPNPLSRDQHLTVRVETIKSGAADIEILDMLGQKVHSQRTSLQSGSNVLTLSNRPLTGGVYLIQVRQGNAVQQARVVQQ